MTTSAETKPEQISMFDIVATQVWKECPQCKNNGQYCLLCGYAGGYYVVRFVRRYEVNL